MCASHTHEKLSDCLRQPKPVPDAPAPAKDGRCWGGKEAVTGGYQEELGTHSWDLTIVGTYSIEEFLVIYSPLPEQRGRYPYKWKFRNVNVSYKKG